MSGEWSPVEPITEAVKEICTEVKPEIEKKVGLKFGLYNPLEHASQIILEGTNYMVKVEVGQNDCVHARISSTLSFSKVTLTVIRTEYPKTLSDPLEPF